MSTANIAHEAEADLERRIPMSYEEWLAWEGSERQSEWVDGEAIVFMPPTIGHADLALFVVFLLRFYLRQHPIGKVYIAPVELRLSPRRSREPDALFVRNENADRITDKRIEGMVDLAVEIVSDDSVRRDRVAKFDDFARAGVREYWITDPRPGREAFDAYALTAAGTYEPIPLDAAGRLRSRVVDGFWVRPEWLLADPLPDPVACLLEIDPDALAPPVP